nr:TIGR04104 family putative zinc finger protein [Tissierella sp.]
MGIQKCSKCGSRLNYVDILESFGWGNKPVICRECGSKHDLRAMYVVVIAVLLSLPILFMGSICSMATTIKLKILVVLLYTMYMAVMVGVYPFVIRYGFREEKI